MAGYTHFGKRNMLTMLKKHGDIWISLLPDNDAVTFSRNGKAMTLGDIKIEFSGRTQREAILEGEFPWVGDVAAKLKRSS